MSPEHTVAEIRRYLAAAPEKVFSAFADAKLVSRWLTPSPEIKLTVLAFDFRVGGAYRFAYHVPGGQIMHVNGAFRSIEPSSKIIFSWNIEPPDQHAGLQSEVVVAIRPDGEGCELHVRHEQLAQAGAVERHSGGWHGAIDLLVSLLESAELSNGAPEEELATDVREHLLSIGAISEVKMFGGIGFLLNGNLVAAVSMRGLLLRIGKDSHKAALARPGTRPMQMRGRTMEGYVYVEPEMLKSGALGAWLGEALKFVRTLPAKAAGKKSPRKGNRT